MKLTEWIKNHINELDKDVEDLRQVKVAPVDEEIENKMEMEDLDFN